MKQQWSLSWRLALSRCASCGKAIERLHTFGSEVVWPEIVWMTTSKCEGCRIEKAKK